MRRSFRNTLGSMLMGAALLTASMAYGQGDAAAAESLFREGMTLLDAGQYDEACQKLTDSNRLDPASGTLLAIALCNEKRGKTATAWAAYVDAAAMARRDGRADREASAQQKASELESRLSRLTIQLSPAARGTPGLEIRRNGQLLPPGALGTALPVDPGKHVVDVTAPGKRPMQITVDIGEDADRNTVDVPALSEDATAAQPGVAAPAPAAPPGEPARGGSTQRTVGFLVGGAGLASLAVGGFFGLQAFSHADDSIARCPTSRCTDPRAVELNDQASTSALISNVLVGIGAVAVATGVVLVLAAPSRSSPTLSGGIGLGGVRLGGSF